MEIIGGILYIAWVVIKYSAIGLFYAGKFVIKYLSPVIACVACFFIGGSCGSSCTSSRFEDWEKETRSKYAHQVVIYWDEAETDYTTIEVREDLNWTINGREGDGDVFGHNGNSADGASTPSPSLPSKTQKSGYEFLGLFLDPNGVGAQVVNAKGYSVVSVKELMSLSIGNRIKVYAVWDQIAVGE